MKLSKAVRRVRAAAIQYVESLEPRLFLSATKISDIPAQAVATGGTTQVTLSTFLNDPAITGGTVIEMQTPEGNIPLQLTDSKTPLTVANFVQYITNGEYTPTIIDRLAAGFVIQGGGFKPGGATNSPVSTLKGEPGISNTVGTIAMALSSGPDSGTNQFFINLANNNGTGSTPNLDTSADGGPFTVFGNVIDGGMTVVNAIAALPVINTSSLGGLPVINFSGSSTTPLAQVPTANLVTDNIVKLTAAQAAPTYSVVSANPALVTASVSNGVLTLTAAPGVTTGSTSVTATVTDLSGETASSTFTVNLNTFTTTVTIGGKGEKNVKFTDSNGTTGVLFIHGKGSAVVNFLSTSLLQVHSTLDVGIVVDGGKPTVDSITTTGTKRSTVLTMIARGGTHAIPINNITTGSLLSFNAPDITLTGSYTSFSPIKFFTIGNASGGSISADSIGTLKSTGAFSDSLVLTNANVSLKKFIGPAITGGVWSISGSATSIKASSIANWTASATGSVGELSVSGSITGSTLKTTGNLRKVFAATLDNSTIFAGINTLSSGQTLPSSITDLATTSSIGLVKLKTSAAHDSFTNSEIAANSLGDLFLGKITTNNGGAVNGVAGRTIKTFEASANARDIKLKKITTSTSLTSVQTELVDFKIQVF
jgi:cyclophilin family peptidyl-prolyl cis-trans isomerase